jgi:hypothetical protein
MTEMIEQTDDTTRQGSGPAEPADGGVGAARRRIEDWRSEAADAGVVSASAVQNRLFDLWGDLRDDPAVGEVERWLSLTVERQLFSGKELVEFLDQLEHSVGGDSAPSTN